jgi:hypothetical protein
MNILGASTSCFSGDHTVKVTIRTKVETTYGAD